MCICCVCVLVCENCLYACVCVYVCVCVSSDCSIIAFRGCDRQVLPFIMLVRTHWRVFARANVCTRARPAASRGPRAFCRNKHTRGRDTPATIIFERAIHVRVYTFVLFLCFTIAATPHCLYLCVPASTYPC